MLEKNDQLVDAVNHWLDHVQQEGKNEAQENLLNQIRLYGFDDLASAERHFAEKDKANAQRNVSG